ncbi:MAG: uroporphyrinogen decarboxylase family protein [Bellilinea sp.]
MKDILNARERLEKCLSGVKPDRPPIALWRHFPVDDQTPDGLASAVAAFQNTHNFDFIKVTPASSFAVKDWGCQDAWKGNSEGTREISYFPIRQADDWAVLKPLEPKSGSLGGQLECLRMLTREFSPRIPVIQTIFSPLSQAKNLVGKENLLYHLRAHPGALHSALKTITRTTMNFIQECKRTGIDGIFYAVQHANYGLLSTDEFITFGKAYDLQILAAVQDLWLNIGHVHGDRIMFDQVVDYPLQILNWHDRQTPPSLAEGLQKFNGAVCGGLRQWETLVLGDPDMVTSEALDAIRQTNGSRFILGTGCVVPITAPAGNIAAARRAVDQL